METGVVAGVAEAAEADVDAVDVVVDGIDQCATKSAVTQGDRDFSSVP